MKKVITKLFLFVVGLLLSFNYVIFPGLTAANTLYNLGASFFAFGVGLYSYHFISDLFDYFTSVDTINNNQLVEEEKPKRKYNRKPKAV